MISIKLIHFIYSLALENAAATAQKVLSVLETY